jgi:hypothetical protein
MAFAPLLIGALGAAATVYQGVKQKQTDAQNADLMAAEGNAAINQANAQEGMVRRNSREALAKQAGAFGGAGVGYSGSSLTALDQSSVNQELDALNTRYRGSFTAWGYKTQSKILTEEGKNAQTAGVLLAGGQAMSGIAKYYAQPGLAEAPSGLGGP